MISKKYKKFEVGHKFLTEGRTLTESDIVTFSSLTGDWAPTHTNKDIASRGYYKERIAQGLLTFAISEALIQRLRPELFKNINEAQYIGLKDLRFIKPVMIGDTLTTDIEIINLKEIENKKGFIEITLKRNVKNQRGETVLLAETKNMIQLSPKKK